MKFGYRQMATNEKSENAGSEDAIRNVGFDPGSHTVRVCVEPGDVALSEPAVVAVRNQEDDALTESLALGRYAIEMAKENPEEITTIRPVRDGIIQDFDTFEAMIRFSLRSVSDEDPNSGLRVGVPFPSSLTTVEKRAIDQAARRAGAQSVCFIEKPIAAGLGAGLPVQEPGGTMIMHIGRERTETAVLSDGEIVTSTSFSVGDRQMDEAIREHVKETHQLEIKTNTAIWIRWKLGTVYSREQPIDMDIEGWDPEKKRIRYVEVSTDEVRDVLDDDLSVILRGVRECLKEISPEMQDDIHERGVILCGIGGFLPGIDQLLSREADVPLTIADDPATTAVRGAYQIVKELGENAS